MTPRVSIVVPTFQRRERLDLVLRGLASQTFPTQDTQVVVVSDGSTDGTAEYLQSGTTPVPVVAVLQDNAGPAAARNAGLARATGELVLFLDDDVVPTPDLVSEHVAAHGRLGPDTVVLGPMLDPPDHRLSAWVAHEQRLLARQYDAMRAGRYEATARQFYTGNASLARHHVEAVGGFDTDFRRAEDVELAYRLADRGLSFAYVHEAAGHHHADRSFASWRDTAYTYGRNDVIFARDHGVDWLADVIDSEFRRRHPAIRLAVRLLVDRPRLREPAVDAISRATVLLDRRGRTGLTGPLLSVLQNVLYYQGVADERAHR